MKKVIVLLALFSTSLFAQQSGSFTDPRDKKTYKTVAIGEQVWMAENLSYNAKDSKCYRDVSSYCAKYGRYYDWGTAKGVCPSGWHLPSMEEWQTLIKFSGGEKVAGQKLKANNGFSALLGGGGSSGLLGINFSRAEEQGYWWSTSEHNNVLAYYAAIVYNSDAIFFIGVTKKDLRNVRCVQNKASAPIAASASSPVAVAAPVEVVAPVEEVIPAVAAATVDTIKNSHDSTPQKESFTDLRDKKSYKFVKIGKQTWMAENLNYHGEDGFLGLCYGDYPQEKIRKPENCKKYGRLYDWKEAKKACPAGWHLPTKAEWQKLLDFAGRDSVAGKKLKAKSGWKTYDFSGNSSNDSKCKWKEEKIDDRGRTTAVIDHDYCTTDEYGFAAFPGGFGYSDGGFDNVGDYGSWWSASENNSNRAYYKHMGYNFEHIDGGIVDKNILFSVRCIKN